jgi:hypothetical protein
MVSGTSLAVIAQEFPAAHHGRTMGIVTMMSSLGAVVSLLATGTLMDRLGWQAAFYLPIPLAIVGLAGTLPLWRSRPALPRVPVDLSGLVLLVLTVLGIYLTASPVSVAGLSDLFQPAMGFLTLLAGGGLLWWERRATHPIFEVRHLRRGGLGMSLGAHCAYHMSMMVTIFSVPFFVERALGLPASRAAGILLPMQVVTTAMAGVGGWLHDRTRSPWLPPGSLLGICLGLSALGWLAGGIPYTGLVAVLIFLGAAGGVFMATNNIAVMSSLGPHLHGYASGMLETVRQLGHGLAIPILTASLTSGGAAAGMAEGAAFAIGFRSAMLVMGGIVFVGVLLAAARRPPAAPATTSAESRVPIVASP